MLQEQLRLCNVISKNRTMPMFPPHTMNSKLSLWWVSSRLL